MDRTVSTASGFGAAAVTPHHHATRAAIETMSAGGNAVDAAIAANAVLGVVLPTTCGIGGDLFTLVHRPGDPAPAALNASGRGGSGLNANSLRRAGHDRIPLYGPESVTVPGCVDGWVALAARFGTRALGDLLAPAIRLARDGFAVSPELSAGLNRALSRISGPQAESSLFPGGNAPAPGSTITRPDLAATLEGIASAGRAAIYQGPAAEAIAGATGGVVTIADLEANRADWVEPIRADALGATAWTMPPNSQGYLAAAAAWLFDALGGGADPADPVFHHNAVECYRAVSWEREHLVADPHLAPLAPDRLLDPDRLRPRLTALRQGRAAAWPQASPAGGGTAYLCTVDAGGIGVSLIQSNFHGIGAGICAGTTGVWLHNRGAGFVLEPGHPNEAAPGKRPLHTLSPTLWTKGGRLRLLLGTRGGHQQPQYVLQAAVLHLAAGVTTETAQAFPRWSMEHAAAGTTSVVRVESRMPAPVVAGLEDRGHRVEPASPWEPGWGPVAMIGLGSDGLREAAADPRIPTAEAAATAQPGSPSPPSGTMARQRLEEP